MNVYGMFINLLERGSMKNKLWLLVVAVLMVIHPYIWQLWDYISLKKRSIPRNKIRRKIMPANEKKFWEAWGQANSLYTLWAVSNNINYYLMFVLYALDGEAMMTQRKICEYTGLTKQTVNGVIRSLKNQGYIVLVPGGEDRREKQVALTERGIAYSQELLAPLHELEHTVFDIMGSERVQQMIDAVTLFNTVFEKEMEKKLK